MVMVKGIATRRKTYVEVVARFDEAGAMTPLSIRMPDGRSYRIARVLDVRKAASLKVGGIGLRYLVEVEGNRTFLFFEDPAWFVEEKVYEE